MKKSFLLLLPIILAISSQPLFGQGTIWGTTYDGGTSGGGVLFKTNFDGTNFQKVIDFNKDKSGRNPISRLVAGPAPSLNGKFYGTTQTGGVYGEGVIFQYDPANDDYIQVYNFSGPEGAFPVGPMLLYNGKFYGLTRSGGASSAGVLFSFDPTSGNFNKEADFEAASTGSAPIGYLTLFNNKFYGITSSGGANNVGVLFEFDPSKSVGSNLTDKYDFDTNSSSPKGELVVYGSLLYGTTSAGGVDNIGTIFEFNPAAAVGSNYTKKVDFDATTGSTPTIGMTLVSSKLYGATNSGGANSTGTIFEYVPGSTSITVKADGPSSYTSSITGTMLYANNLLYGNNAYAIFSYDPTQSGPASFQIVSEYDYNGTGQDVEGGFTLGPGGVIFGLAYSAGIGQGGTIMKYDPSQPVTSTNPVATISFNTAAGFYNPLSLLYLNGKLYGHSNLSNVNEGGIFEYDPSAGSFINTGFDYFLQNKYPRPPLVLNGKLIGTIGTVTASIYEYDPASHTIIDKMATNMLTDAGGFASASNGKFYGFSGFGGANNKGYIIEYDPVANAETKKIDFESNFNANGLSKFFPASNGLLYAVSASKGGANSKGYILEYDPSSNTVTQKYDFNTGQDWYLVTGLMACTANGKLYGLRPAGGANGAGSIFEYSLPTSAAPNGVVKEVYSFSATGPRSPLGIMVESGNGKLYGMTNVGGDNSVGTLFEFDPITNTYADKISLTPINGMDNPALVVIPDPQTITFNSLPSKPYGEIFKAGATASSGLPITYTSSNTDVAIIKSDTIIVRGIGTTTITAYQKGNGGYLAATPVQQTLTTTKISQVITFAALISKKSNDAAFILNATASSSLAVTYTSSNTAVATVSGNAVTIVGRGSTDIQASQAGNTIYNAAVPVTQTLTVVNTPPAVDDGISDQEALQLSPFTFTFSANAFSDVDSDVLNYTATRYNGDALPPWLSFASSTRTFSGTPGVGDTTVSIHVTANDNHGGTITSSFKIRIKIITGVEPNANALLEIYPNPVHHILTVENVSGDDLPITVRSSLGEVIYQNERKGKYEINALPWAAGLYFVEVRQGSTIIQRKIIKY